MSFEGTRDSSAPVNTAIQQADPVYGGDMGEDAPTDSPLVLVRNRLHGRMLPMIVLGPPFPSRSPGRVIRWRR